MLEAVALANTLYDFLNGQIVGKDYVWNASQRDIFQDCYRDNDSDCKLEDPGKRERVGLPYRNSDFKWDDEARQPETKPVHASAMRKGLDCAVIMNEDYADTVTMRNPSS